MSDRADELYAALLAAQGDRAVLEALARVIRWNECGRESSDDNLPLPKELATWLPESPKADLAEADERLAALFGSYAEWGVFFYLYYRVAAVVDTERDPSIPVVDMDPDTKRVALLHTIEEVHAAWVAAYENDSDLLHPLAPLVAAWQRQKPPAFAHVSTTATGRGTSMTRRTKMESIIRPVPWTEAAMTGALVDGIPTATRVPDPRGIFPQRRPVRRLFRIDEQLMLKLPGIPEVPFDLRLIALQDISADPDSSPVLPNDVLVLLNLAHAADRPFVLTEHEGAALLVRHSDGTHRPVQPQYDYKRFWNASYVLRTLVVFDPAGSGRWIDMAIVEIRDVQPVDRVVIGPPHWARPITDTSKWTLTAEGSLAAVKRVSAGKTGLAGRIVTGIEYFLAAGYDGSKLDRRAPALRPVHARRKGGPGRVVAIGWRNALRHAGDWWDETDSAADKASLRRFDRSMEILKKRGYFVPNVRAEAAAGDSVEIVNRVRGARNRPAQLLVRSSARFVQAAHLAQLPDGRGFETMRLTDWAGLPKVY